MQTLVRTNATKLDGLAANVDATFVQQIFHVTR